MSRKIARITQDKKLLLANEVVEDNTKIRLDSDGRLDIDEIIEYPAELEGGRNLIENSDFVNGIENWTRNQNVSLSIVDKKLKVIFNQETSTPGVKTLKNLVLPTGTYTISAKVKGSYQGLLFTFYAGSSLPGKNTSLTGEWEVVTRTIDLIEPIDYQFMMLTFSPTLESYFLIDWVKFEKGSQATPWTPAPEDLGLNYPDSIQNFNSSISGNNIIAPEFIEGYPFVKPVIDDSLVLWLDGTTGNNYEQTGTWKDLSGKGNDGELVNFGYIEDSGWGDGGLKFDGVDDYVNCGNGESLNITDDLTIEMLVYVPEDGEFGGVVKGSQGTWASNSYGLRSYYGSCSFYITDGNNVSQINIAIPKGKLVSIVGTTSKVSNIMKGYKNGILVSSRERGIEDIQVQQDGLYVGMGYTAALTKGNIFLVRIYNRALTDEEILQNYQAGQCSPLLAMRGDV